MDVIVIGVKRTLALVDRPSVPLESTPSTAPPSFHHHCEPQSGRRTGVHLFGPFSYLNIEYTGHVVHAVFINTDTDTAVFVVAEPKQPPVCSDRHSVRCTARSGGDHRICRPGVDGIISIERTSAKTEGSSAAPTTSKRWEDTHTHTAGWGVARGALDGAPSRALAHIQVVGGPARIFHRQPRDPHWFCCSWWFFFWINIFFRPMQEDTIGLVLCGVNKKQLGIRNE